MMGLTEPISATDVMFPFEGTRTIIPAPPSGTRTINARNRPPPVAGVSFGSGETRWNHLRETALAHRRSARGNAG